MANYVVSDTSLTAVADAIRTKGDTAASLAFPSGFVSAINAIPTGGGGDYEIASGTVTPTDSLYSVTVSVGFEPGGALIYTDPYSTEQTSAWKRFLIFADRVAGFATGMIVRYLNGAYGTNVSGLNETGIGTYSDGEYTFVRMGANNFLPGTTYTWVCWRAVS